MPDLTFGDPDGSTGDALASDASNDAQQQQDGGDAGGCTGMPPGGSNVCCTGKWCGGSCSQTDCKICLATCADPTKVCCKLNNGNFVCKTAGTTCPP